MIRLRFLTMLVILFVLGSAGAVEAKKVTLKLATLAPDGSAWDKILREMASEWKEETGGRVQLRIYPGGVAGDEPDIVRKIRIKQLQAATFTTAGLSTLDEAFNIFAIPLFFESFEEFLYVRNQLSPVLTQRLEERGFKFVHWGHGGWVHLFLTRPAYTMSELATIKMWTWAGDDRMAEVWKASGFSPVPLSSTDILTGFQTGLIEGMPTTPYAALAMQWYRHTPYMLGMAFSPLIGGTVIALDSWNKISPEDQAVLLESGREADEQILADISVSDEEAVGEMVKRGMTVISKDEWDNSWEGNAAKFASEMKRLLIPPEIYDLAVQHRDDFRAGKTGGE